MERMLVVGVDSVVGGNLAAQAVERCPVAGVWFNRCVEIEGCDCQPTPRATSIEAYVTQFAPDCVIYCGPESHSSWESDVSSRVLTTPEEQAVRWAMAARTANAAFVMVSSDAVFTGPWMFHDEQSPSHCDSPASQAILRNEAAVRSAHPGVLVIRTNAFGWSPTGDGFVENLFQKIESRRGIDPDHIRHSTPILATDLADIIDRAVAEGLTGIFHVAGAERVSPTQFAQRLADQFDLPWLTQSCDTTLTGPRTGFGEGECSLQTKAIRKALCVAMPMMAESLERLARQQVDGHRDRLHPISHQDQSRAA